MDHFPKAREEIKKVYTLEKLYDSLSVDKRDIDSKIETLTRELGTRSIGFESITKNPETRLKLLENKYRREISDQ